MTFRASLLLFLVASWCSLAYPRTFEIKGRPYQHAHEHNTADTRSIAGCSNGFRYRFVRYQASDFEQSWKQEIASGNMDACSFIQSHTSQYRAWLDGVKVFDNFVFRMDSPWPTDPPPRTEGSLPADVFSKMIYVNTCPGQFAGITREIYVEPLAGHLRHPLAHGVCKQLPNEEHPVSVMDLSYMLLNPWSAADLNLNFNGKRYLFDLGTSTFNTSAKYLTTRYQQAGMTFDQIWAWEVASMQPEDYWAAVPDVYKSRLHFYNTPITKNFTEASHPLNIIRSIYQPGDFIVVKLDIDNGPLELAIMKEIESNPVLLSSITEMMFEQHYDHEDMQAFFGLANGASLRDTTDNFVKFREAGLLLHYWP